MTSSFGLPPITCWKLPFIRKTWVYDKHGRDRGLPGFSRQIRRLRQSKYDLALLPHRSLRSGLLAWRAGIPIRVGFDRGGGRFLHTHKVPYPATLHKIQRNLQLLSPFGPIPQVDPPIVISNEDDLRFVEGKLGENAEPMVALSPGSTWFTKRWPEAYFLALGKKLASAGYRIVLIGGGDDRELGQRIAHALGSACWNFCGILSLRQSVEVLRRCSVLVTNDSAPTHLGTAAGIRVLTLFGSTIPEFGFGPFGPNGKPLGIELYCRPCTDHGRQHCPEKHFRCMRELTPERVFEEIQKALAVTIP